MLKRIVGHFIELYYYYDYYYDYYCATWWPSVLNM